jgi:hypothetical protein
VTDFPFGSTMRSRLGRHLARSACAVALSVSCLPALGAERQPVESPLLPTDGSVRVLWQRVFASPADDWINDIVAMHDGTFMAVGYLNRQETKSGLAGAGGAAA